MCNVCFWLSQGRRSRRQRREFREKRLKGRQISPPRWANWFLFRIFSGLNMIYHRLLSSWCFSVTPEETVQHTILTNGELTRHQSRGFWLVVSKCLLESSCLIFLLSAPGQSQSPALSPGPGLVLLVQRRSRSSPASEAATMKPQCRRKRSLLILATPPPACSTLQVIAGAPGR